MELPERIQQAIEEGRMTREQAEERMRQRQQGEEGEGRTGREPGAQQGQLATMAPEDIQLREGLTVTVSIVVDERNGVLLVPGKAITTRGRKTHVNVISTDGTIEERTIETGISDFQFTEVTEGLSEGEQIIIPPGTTTITSRTSTQDLQRQMRRMLR